ncbi:hypothetical protein B0H10DRAFT_2374070 [Mycena sp. CBHHK59/15]|nr:hypothetical protein B0H10DRAFT_2374070 [Mycena sp. CBHHK59/15]
MTCASTRSWCADIREEHCRMTYIRRRLLGENRNCGRPTRDKMLREPHYEPNATGTVGQARRWLRPRAKGLDRTLEGGEDSQEEEKPRAHTNKAGRSRREKARTRSVPPAEVRPGLCKFQPPPEWTDILNAIRPLATGAPQYASVAHALGPDSLIAAPSRDDVESQGVKEHRCTHVSQMNVGLKQFQKGNKLRRGNVYLPRTHQSDRGPSRRG